MRITKGEALVLATALRQRLNADVKSMNEFPWTQSFKNLTEGARRARRIERLVLFSLRKSPR